MSRFFLPRACLAVGALACLAASAPAADLDKYLPDDAQSVMVVNVKQITSWTPFQKQIKDEIEQMLKMGPPAEILKDTGFDPVRDLDRVVVVAAASSPQIIRPPQFTAPKPPPPPGAVPPGAAAPPPGLPPPPPLGSISTSSGSPIGFPTFILLQGKFDADKLEAKAQQALKDHPNNVKKPRMVNGMELWEIGSGGGDHVYLAMLDKETVLATGLESQALEALDKAAGKKKTDLLDKQVRDGLAKADPKAAVQVTASGDLVTRVTSQSDGKGGFTTTTRSMRDDGIQGYRGVVTLGDADLHYELSLTAKDGDKAMEMTKSMTDGLADAVKHVTTEAQQNKDLLPLVDALKAVKIASRGDAITVEGSATAEQVEATAKAFFTLRPPEIRPPEVRPPDNVRTPDRTPPVKPPDDPKPPKKDK